MLVAVFRKNNVSAPCAVFVVNDSYGLHGFFALPLHCCSLSKLVVAVGCFLLFCMLSPAFGRWYSNSCCPPYSQHFGSRSSRFLC